MESFSALRERPYRAQTSHALCFTKRVLKKHLSLLVLIIIAFDLTGCALSGQARRERAYRHYVQKQIKQRRREMARAQKAANRELKLKTESIQPSEPKITSSAESLPDFSPEPVAPPVTVSASDSITNQAPDEPSQP